MINSPIVSWESKPVPTALAILDLTENLTDSKDQGRQAGIEIEITPEMAERGGQLILDLASEGMGPREAEELAQLVYLEMAVIPH